MEIGLESRIRTYSGGLGVLAGDMAYSFADLGRPATFVTLLSRNGYASQKLDSAAGQLDAPEPWDWKGILTPTGAKATMDGVVRAPSAFSITLGAEPSMTATHEFVVPRSMPITLAISVPLIGHGILTPKGVLLSIPLNSMTK